MTIRAILFDADEVLQYPDPGRDADLASVLGFVPEPVARFVAEVHAAEDATLTGSLDFREALTPVLARWGVANKADELRDWLNAITVDEGMLQLVSRLRGRGYCCALATNQQPHRAAFMARQLGYQTLFERCFFSCEMGVAKPDPRYFQMILAELQHEPSEVLFVDDKPQNVHSARTLGIHVVCFANSRDGRAPDALREILGRLGVDADT